MTVASIDQATSAVDQAVPSLLDAKRYIDSLDFSKIIDKMVKHQGWKLKHALKASEQYRHYLWLCRKYSDQQLPPSDDIDEFWHNHVLDTINYRQDCQHIFGKYLDHYPYFGIDDQSDASDLNQAFVDTRRLYQQEFGSPLTLVRGHWSVLLGYCRRFLVK